MIPPRRRRDASAHRVSAFTGRTRAQSCALGAPAHCDCWPSPCGKRLAPDRCACDSQRCADLRCDNFKPADELFFTASRCLRREKCARACRINKARAAGSIQSSLKLAQPTRSKDRSLKNCSLKPLL